jgi:hypothetical protein
VTPIILALIQQGVIPEVLAFIRERFTRTGALPTDEEVIAALVLKADAITAIGVAWLESHPADPIP